ncbi:MAG: magnesium transporter CorA family protein [Solirubrobacterales bacterium]
MDGEPSQIPGHGDRERHRIGCVANESIDQIRGALERDEYVWLNLTGATSSEIERAGEELGLHPLTIEDLEEFDQRAKVEDYGNYVYIVAYGATLAREDDDKLVEVHIIYSPKFLATVAAEESLALGKLHDQAEDRSYSGHELLHTVLDALVDSYAPVLDHFDGEIEHLEELLVRRDLKGRELDIHDLRRRLARIDRTVHRQLESFTSIREVLRRMPDHHAEDFPYFRDLQDHLIHVAESADAMRERIAGLFELYMAALDNRQNIIMKQFTVIAGIFLPLSVVTGFFGMNFGWMIREISGHSAFLLLGVFFPAVILCLLIAVIAGRGLFRE